MTGKDCNIILDGLIVNEDGELILDENFREHLNQCQNCRKVYENIQKAKSEEVPDFVSPVMQRIRDIESIKESSSVIDKLREIFESFKFMNMRLLIPVTVVAVALVISLGIYFVPGNNQSNGIDEISSFADLDLSMRDIEESLLSFDKVNKGLSNSYKIHFESE
ncbi:hypothetical protein GF312_14045 [Candidatus Poribacteria bacterium]|nr:hypothetical protein [Candidatus Poribacteria bacterium]